MKKKRPAITTASIVNPTIIKYAKTEPGTKTGAMDGDARLSSVQKKPIKANVNRHVPTTFLKFRLLPNQHVSRVSFFYPVAYSMHAPSSDTLLKGTKLRARAITMYREMCGIQVAEQSE